MRDNVGSGMIGVESTFDRMGGRLEWNIVQGYAGGEDVAGVFVSGGGIASQFIVLTIVGYVVYAFMNGGKYRVVFMMDDEGITYKQPSK